MIKKDTKMPKKRVTKKKPALKKANYRIKKRKAPEPLLVKKKYVRDYINAKGGRLSPEAFASLSEVVEALCDKAIERARENGRQTVRTQDF